jgi:hypothetical protein
MHVERSVSDSDWRLRNIRVSTLLSCSIIVTWFVTASDGLSAFGCIVPCHISGDCGLYLLVAVFFFVCIHFYTQLSDNLQSPAAGIFVARFGPDFKACGVYISCCNVWHDLLDEYQSWF